MEHAMRPIALVVTLESAGYYNGDYVRLNGMLIGHRPYDGSDSDEICDEVTRTLANMVGEKLGWKQEAPKDEWD